MRLQAGEPAPDLEVADVFGAAVSLRAWRGRPVLLSFYRYAGCPICNLRLRDLREAAPALQAQGLRLVGVFQSGAATLRRHLADAPLPFPLVADPGLALYRRYGVERRWAALLSAPTLAAAAKAMAAGLLPGRIDGPVDRVPADFLIGADGRIRIAHYGRHLADHLPLDALVPASGAAAA